MPELYGQWRRIWKLKIVFRLICRVHCLLGEKTRNFSLPCGSGNNICHQHKELSLGPFLKANRQEHHRNSRKCRERSSCHTCSLLAAARSHGASSQSNFSCICCINCLNFTDKWTMVLKIKQKFKNMQTFRNYGWETGCGVSKLTACSYHQTLSTVPYLCYFGS